MDSPTRPENEPPAGGETGTLSLTIAGAVTGRTIMPEIGMECFAQFRLTFAGTDTGGELPHKILPARDLAYGIATIDLPTGIWNLHVTAYKEVESGSFLGVAAGGENGITVPSGGNVNATVTLAPIPVGTGTLRWNLDFYTGIVVAEMEIVRWDDGESVAGPFRFRGDVPLTEIACYVSLGAGRYRVVLMMHNGREEVAISEVLHVYTNMVSVFDREFCGLDFPVSLERIVLNAWDSATGTWNFADEITIAHLNRLMLESIEDIAIEDIVYWFNKPGFATRAPVDGFDLSDFRVLTDAVLVGMAGTNADFTRAGSYLHRAYAESAIEGLVRNGTVLTFSGWDVTGGRTVRVGIGAYEVEIIFNDAVPLLDADGNIVVPRDRLVDHLAWLRTYARDNKSYLIEVIVNETVTPAQTALPSGINNLSVTLRGSGGNRTVGLPSAAGEANQGVLFTVVSGVTLILDQGITLVGRNGGTLALQNNNHLVRVNNGGTLIMNAGTGIINNTNASGTGVNSSGGVLVNSGGTFTMNGGHISNNVATNSGGGGIRVLGTFRMYGGEIYRNTTTSSSAGVYVHTNGIFTMFGGTVAFNNAGNSGGGVGVVVNGVFRMYGGTLWSNEATVAGGGISAVGNSTFYMHDGAIISGNRASWGGGVNLGSTFTMHGGIIRGNGSIAGGGVFITDSAFFRMGGGIIYGAAVHLENIASSGGISMHIRDATARAQFGPFIGSVFSAAGDLDTENRTIEVRDGVLIRPMPQRLIRVEGGSFDRGICPSGQNVVPQNVHVSCFYMMRFEVTQGEWYDVMGRERPGYFRGGPGVNWRNLPVEQVSWRDAVRFANAKSTRAGLTPVYTINGTTITWDRSANGYRLPTEAEWEFAARGGIFNNGNYRFSGGNVAGDVAWYRGNSGNRTHEVGMLRSNALGLFDMSGNVLEWVWCASENPGAAGARLARGGSWLDAYGLTRPVVRTWGYPHLRHSNLGFRLARSSPSFVRIEGGTFLMGFCPSGASETPLRSVTVSSFHMSRFPVTQGKWYDVMGTRPSHFRGDRDANSNPVTGVNWRSLPVERVSWYDAIVFSNRLSIQRGLTPAYSIGDSTNPANWGPVPTGNNATWNAVTIVPGSTGYRLPTEAQWEFAARGGIVCQGNFVFSGSNVAAEVAWIRENSGYRTREVGTLAPNALGLYDMSGNVFEWVWDWFGTYPSVAETDPVGASSGSDRVERGGGWRSTSGHARSAFRGWFIPSSQLHDLGFRLVRP